MDHSTANRRIRRTSLLLVLGGVQRPCLGLPKSGFGGNILRAELLHFVNQHKHRGNKEQCSGSGEDQTDHRSLHGLRERFAHHPHRGPTPLAPCP
jgi:hypothetical protein